MLASSLCGYSDAYILVSGTKGITNTGTTAVPRNTKKIIIENCTPFTDWISELNNTEIDSAKDIDIVMQILNLN